jgi:uncharacterized protein YcaQ
VNAAHKERHADGEATAEAAAAELGLMARWLGLEGVDVNARGDLAEALHRAVARL